MESFLLASSRGTTTTKPQIHSPLESKIVCARWSSQEMQGDERVASSSGLAVTSLNGSELINLQIQSYQKLEGPVEEISRANFGGWRRPMMSRRT